MQTNAASICSVPNNHTLTVGWSNCQVQSSDSFAARPENVGHVSVPTPLLEKAAEGILDGEGAQH